VGDEIYGRKKPTMEIDRHFLHAYRLKILLPGEPAPRSFEAPLPPELERVLTFLRVE
jgi:23S rRNA pseudouridine1911/1915/1917 synthase